MRKAILFIAVLVLAGSLWAADPIIGTWKLNIAKSKNLSSLPVMVQMEIYREINGDDIELAIRGKKADGSPLSYQIIYPRQGGQVRYPQAVEEGRSEVQLSMSLTRILASSARRTPVAYSVIRITR